MQDGSQDRGLLAMHGLQTMALVESLAHASGGSDSAAPGPPIEKWKMYVMDVPEQDKGFDCGVFAIMFALQASNVLL